MGEKSCNAVVTLPRYHTLMNRVAFVFPMVAFVTSTPVFAQNQAELVKQAEAAQAAQRWDEAERLYTQLIALDPKQASFFANRGYIRNGQKRYPQAIEDHIRAEALYRKGDSTSRNLAIVLVNRGDNFLRLNDPLRALAEAITACKVDETFAFAWALRADAWYALGNLAEAESCLASAKQRNASISRSFSREQAEKNAQGHLKVDDKADTDADFTAGSKANEEKRYAEGILLFSRVLERRPLVSGAWVNRGNAHYAQNHYDQAIADYSTAISLRFTFSQDLEGRASALTNRANAYRFSGRPDAAGDDCELALKVKPDYTRAQTILTDLMASPLARAVALLADGKAREAIPLLDSVLKSEPKNAPAWLLRGKAEELGAIFADKDALVFYNRAIDADPNLAEAYARRGQLRRRLLTATDSDREGAREDLKKAVALGYEDPEAFSDLASALEGAKDLAGAVEQLNKAIRLAPKEGKYLRQRASLYERQKDWERAITDWTSLIALKPEASVYEHRGDTLVEARAFDRALADFTKAIELDPKDADLLVARARAKRLSGDRVGALADYSAAHAQDPSLPAVAADLSNADKADAARHDFQRALQKISESSKALLESQKNLLKAQLQKAHLEARLQRFVAGDKRTPAEVVKEVSTALEQGIADAEDYLDRARAYARLSKFPEAIADATKAIALKADFPEAYNWRGVCYETTKAFEKAFTDYDKAVALQPTRAEYVRNRGDMHYELKRYDAAQGDYTKAITLDPKSADSFFKRGNAHFMLKKYEEAISDYDKAIELKPDFETAKSNREVAKKRKASG